MYICKNCGKAIENEELKSVTHWLDDEFGSTWEQFVCPYCDSDEIVEAEECLHCHKPKYIKYGEICEDCVKELSTKENFAKSIVVGECQDYLFEEFLSKFKLNEEQIQKILDIVVPDDEQFAKMISDDIDFREFLDYTERMK